MKAGQYFQCQSLFLDMIGEVHKMNSQIEVAEKNKNETGKLEITFWDIMKVIPDKMLVFLSACLSMDIEELKNNANPEEIPVAYSKVVALNNFYENIKNFVAPIRESLGV